MTAVTAVTVPPLEQASRMAATGRHRMAATGRHGTLHSEMCSARNGGAIDGRGA